MTFSAATMAISSGGISKRFEGGVTSVSGKAVAPETKIPPPTGNAKDWSGIAKWLCAKDTGFTIGGAVEASQGARPAPVVTQTVAEARIFAAGEW